MSLIIIQFLENTIKQNAKNTLKCYPLTLNKSNQNFQVIKELCGIIILIVLNFGTQKNSQDLKELIYCQKILF